MTRVLITGASKGIGYATALRLARAGHDVVATMRNPAVCDLAEVAAVEGLVITVAELDVDDDGSVARLFASPAGDPARLDALINNAGVYAIETVEDETLAHFQQVMNTNFFGAVRCIKAVVPAMRTRGSGLIVNVASVAGRIASFASAAYAASKFAMEAMSESLAQEVAGFGVRVALVEPGIIATEMTVANLPRPKATSAYPRGPRMRAYYAATPVSGAGPAVVAETIAGIVSGDITAFRSPSGPDALPFLAFRQNQSDEAFIKLGGILDNPRYFRRFLAMTGIDLRQTGQDAALES